MSVERMLRAIQHGDTEEVRTLVEDRPELGAARTADGLPLILHALYHRRPEIARTMAELRTEPLSLLEAAALGDAARVTALLEADPGNVATRSADGFTALHYAAFFGHPEVAEALVERGADPDAVAEGPTRVRPLHSAAASRSGAVARILLGAGAEPDPRQAGGYTPLMAAALHGDEELAEVLLEAGADPLLETDDGRSCVDLAGEGGHPALRARLAAG